MVFKRVLVGFDGSAEAERALTGALALRAAGGALRAVTIAETHHASRTGMDAPAWDARLRAEAEEARERAAALLADVTSSDAIAITGRASYALLGAATEFEADLIAVGSRGTGRLAGVLLGSVATRVAHDAACSVLIAQGSRELTGNPQTIVAGIDGSAPAAQALAVAEELATATGASVTALEATDRPPVEALVDASRSADLLVVGSRGATGLAALGSVAERVAHQADCPVLIVRDGPT